ncbi:hypothetical protein QF039_002611 [Pseudomonas sp. W2I6]|nr:hypothetical protein [Pseudomonas sp. W2I6]
MFGEFYFLATNGMLSVKLIRARNLITASYKFFKGVCAGDMKLIATIQRFA